jgi:hypothetical protein
MSLTSQALVCAEPARLFTAGGTWNVTSVTHSNIIQPIILHMNFLEQPRDWNELTWSGVSLPFLCNSANILKIPCFSTEAKTGQSFSISIV